MQHAIFLSLHERIRLDRHKQVIPILSMPVSRLLDQIQSMLDYSRALELEYNALIFDSLVTVIAHHI